MMSTHNAIKILYDFLDSRLPEGHGYFILMNPRGQFMDTPATTLTNLDNNDAYELIEDWLADYKNTNEYYNRAREWQVLEQVKMYLYLNISPMYDFIFLARALKGYGNQEMRAMSDIHSSDAYKIMDDWYRHVYDRPDILDNF